MKHFILVFIGFFILISSAEAQPYKSIFAKDTTEWRVYECRACDGGTFSFYTYSDTIINSKVYKIMYYEYVWNENFKIGHDKYIWLGGYLREDRATGKYWFIKNDDGKLSKEILLWDLSLAKGDTFKLISYYENFEDVVVDSSYIINGKKIVKLNFIHFDCYSENNLTFTEGIGPSTGLYNFYRDGHDARDFSLMCKFDNGIKIYSTPSDRDSNCFRPGGGDVKEQELKLDINLYPNPATSVFWLDIPEAGGRLLSYEIYNNLGEKITGAPIVSTKTKIELPVSGTYYIFITDGKKRTLRKVVFL